MKSSKIEWCDHTFNPWEGCTKVSPGCAHCYAEARNRRFSAGSNWGPGAPRRRTSVANWRQPLAWNRTASLAELAAAADCTEYHRPRVFCGSLCDWLDDAVPIEWLSDLLVLICRTPNLDWLMLMKRPQNWRGRIERARDHAASACNFRLSDSLTRWLISATPPDNIWLGATVEDQQRADERIPQLLAIPARVRFLSCEPLLGPIDLRAASRNTALSICDPAMAKRHNIPRIDWVICGGESGPHARPMHPDWARALRDQCAAAGVPFFFKAWGNHDEFGNRTGKHTAGRLLDGREYSDLPTP